MSATLRLETQSDLGFAQLLRLALKKLAIENTGRLWLDEDPARLHTKVKDLQASLQDRLPALATLHFLDRGAHPYSRDVAVALEILQQSGAINRENPSYTRFSPRTHKDTKEKIAPEIDRLFPAGTGEREAFEELVRGLAELATTE